MNLKEQSYVCVLAECGNITKASERLYISQPALSIYINNLEKYLGMKLFERTGKKFVLTNVGEIYVEKAKKMLELKKEFDEELGELLDNKRGRIRLGVQLRREAWLLPPVLAEFKREYPGIEVVIREGTMHELWEMLEGYELDLVLMNAAFIRKDMQYQELFEEEILIAVPQVNPLNEKSAYVEGSRYRSLDLKWLEGEALILQHPNQSIRADVDAALKEAGIRPGSIQVIRNIETAIQMVAEGLGIGFNRESYAINMKYRKRVNYYTIGESPKKSSFVAGYRRGMHVSTYMQRFIDLISAQGKENIRA